MNPQTEPRYQYQEVLAIPRKKFTDYERDGFHIYAMSRFRDEVTLRLRREVESGQRRAR